MNDFWLIQKRGTDYGLDKPLVIGEFASVCAEGRSIQTLYNYGYSNGYQVGTLLKKTLQYHHSSFI